MSTFNTSLSYHNSSSYPSDTGGNEGGLNTDTGGLHSRAREKYPNLLRGSGVAAEASPTGEFAEGVERIAYRATSNYFARVLNLPQDSDGRLRVDKENVFRHFDWKNERVADMTVDSIFDDVISQVAAERSRRGQSSRGNVKAHADLTASKFTADKGDYASRLDQMVQSIGGPELLEALRKASELITSQMDEDEEDSDSDISSPNMRAPDMPPAPSVPTSARPVIGSAKAAGASQGSSKAGASSGASSASSAEAQAAQEKIAKALESGGDDLVSLSENDELMKHASEEQKSEMIAKLQEHSDKKGKCDSRPEGNKADRAIANVLQSAKDKTEFDNLMQEHGGQDLMHALEYDEAKQTLVQAAAAWGSNEFIDEKLEEKYSKEIAASQDLFINPPDQSSTIQPLAASSYASDPTATGMERIEGETNAYIEDQAYTNLSTRAQREMLLMNAERTSEGKEEVDNTEVIREVEDLRAKTLAQIEAGDEESYKEEWEAWKKGLEEIRKEHAISEDAFRHTVTSRYENFYLGTNVSFGEPDSEDKDERSDEEKYHSYTRDAADLKQLREKYGQAPTSSVNGLEASSSLGATGVAGQAAQEELHKLLQEYELVVEEEGFESRRAETVRQEIADLEESSSEYTADLNKIGVELDTLYQPPPADTFWLKFTEVFLAVAELAMTLAAAAFLGPAGVALVSAGWAIYHATQKDWMAMAGSLAGGAVGGMGAASGAIAKSAAKGSQTGATLARGIGSKAATSTTKAAATTGAKSASSFSQNVSNLVAKTGKAGQFMGLNPSDDVLITTGKLTNMSQTTFETSYAASQGDALGAASSSLGLSQEGMNARRLTRLTQNSATAAVTTTYTVQAGQKFADGNYQGAFDLIGGVSNVGNLSGSNEHFKAGIGGVNEGLPTVDYSRSENLDTATADAPDKESSLSGSEEADAVESAEETKRTEAEEAERARVAKEVEQKRLTGRSSQVKVEQMLEDILGADVAKNIDAYYDPTMPEGQVRYTPDPDEQGKLQLSYGPKSNEQNIQWHVEHLDTLLQYNDNQGVGVLLPALSKPEAITLLEFDKHEKLIAKAQAVIADDTGEYSAVDKAMAKENLAFYEQEQAEIMQRISSEEHSHQLDAEGRRYVAGVCLGKPKTSHSEGLVEPRAEKGPTTEGMPPSYPDDFAKLINSDPNKGEEYDMSGNLVDEGSIKNARNEILAKLTTEQKEVFYNDIAQTIYDDLPGKDEFLEGFAFRLGKGGEHDQPHWSLLSTGMKNIAPKQDWLIKAATEGSSLSTLQTLDRAMLSSNDESPKFLYHGEELKTSEGGLAAYETVFKSGLISLGTNMDLDNHINDTELQRSGFVATSKNFFVADKFAAKLFEQGEDDYRNVYILTNDGSGRDVIQESGLPNPKVFPQASSLNEYEVAFPRQVRSENIVGVIRVPQARDLDKPTVFVPNPNYVADGVEEASPTRMRSGAGEFSEVGEASLPWAEDSANPILEQENVAGPSRQAGSTSINYDSINVSEESNLVTHWGNYDLINIFNRIHNGKIDSKSFDPENATPEAKNRYQQWVKFVTDDTNSAFLAGAFRYGNDGASISASLNNGVLKFTIKFNRENAGPYQELWPEVKEADFFSKMMLFYGDDVKEIKGAWLDRPTLKSNHNSYWSAVDSAFDRRTEAPFLTFTGTLADTFGFSEVKKVEPTVNEDSMFSSIDLLIDGIFDSSDIVKDSSNVSEVSSTTRLDEIKRNSDVFVSFIKPETRYNDDFNELFSLENAEDIRAKRDKILSDLMPEEIPVFYKDVAEKIYNDLPDKLQFLNSFAMRKVGFSGSSIIKDPRLSQAMKDIDEKGEWLKKAASSEVSYSLLNDINHLFGSNETDTPSILFRGNDPQRSIDSVFKEGFKARGENRDLMAHVAKGNESAFISTSKDLNTAYGFADVGQNIGGRIYVIKNKGEGIDVAQELGERQTSASTIEHEVAFEKQIKPSDIEGVIELRLEGNNELAVFVPNPSYVADDTGKYIAADKAMAEENLAIYEQEQTEIMQRISDEEHTQQFDAQGRRYVAGVEEASPTRMRGGAGGFSEVGELDSSFTGRSSQAKGRESGQPRSTAEQQNLAAAQAYAADVSVPQETLLNQYKPPADPLQAATLAALSIPSNENALRAAQAAQAACFLVSLMRENQPGYLDALGAIKAAIQAAQTAAEHASHTAMSSANVEAHDATQHQIYGLIENVQQFLQAMHSAPESPAGQPASPAGQPASPAGQPASAAGDSLMQVDLATQHDEGIDPFAEDIDVGGPEAGVELHEAMEPNDVVNYIRSSEVQFSDKVNLLYSLTPEQRMNSEIRIALEEQFQLFSAGEPVHGDGPQLEPQLSTDDPSFEAMPLAPESPAGQPASSAGDPLMQVDLATQHDEGIDPFAEDIDVGGPEAGVELHEAMEPNDVVNYIRSSEVQFSDKVNLLYSLTPEQRMNSEIRIALEEQFQLFSAGEPVHGDGPQLEPQLSTDDPSFEAMPLAPESPAGQPASSAGDPLMQVDLATQHDEGIDPFAEGIDVGGPEAGVATEQEGAFRDYVQSLNSEQLLRVYQDIERMLSIGNDSEKRNAFILQKSIANYLTDEEKEAHQNFLSAQAMPLAPESPAGQPASSAGEPLMQVDLATQHDEGIDPFAEGIDVGGPEAGVATEQEGALRDYVQSLNSEQLLRVYQGIERMLSIGNDSEKRNAFILQNSIANYLTDEQKEAHQNFLSAQAMPLAPESPAGQPASSAGDPLMQVDLATQHDEGIDPFAEGIDVGGPEAGVATEQEGALRDYVQSLNSEQLLRVYQGIERMLSIGNDSEKRNAFILQNSIANYLTDEQKEAHQNFLSAQAMHSAPESPAGQPASSAGEPLMQVDLATQHDEDIDPFAEDIDPFAEDIDPFAEGIDPFAEGFDESGPEAGVELHEAMEPNDVVNYIRSSEVQFSDKVNLLNSLTPEQRMNSEIRIALEEQFQLFSAGEPVHGDGPQLEPQLSTDDPSFEAMPLAPESPAGQPASSAGEPLMQVDLATQHDEDIDPFAEDIDPFAEDIDPFAEDIDPFAEGIDPFAEGIDPFAEDIDPFAEDIDPFAEGFDESGPEAGVELHEAMEPNDVVNYIRSSEVQFSDKVNLLNSLTPEQRMNSEIRIALEEQFQLFSAGEPVHGDGPQLEPQLSTDDPSFEAMPLAPESPAGQPASSVGDPLMQVDLATQHDEGIDPFAEDIDESP